MGSAIEGAGQKLMPVTAAVGGLTTAAVKVASDFDSAMSQVAAVSGATGKELDALHDKAREVLRFRGGGSHELHGYGGLEDRGYAGRH